jgi:hypothetical protein
MVSHRLNGGWLASDRLEGRLVDRCAAPRVEQPCAGRPEDNGEGWRRREGNCQIDDPVRWTGAAGEGRGWGSVGEGRGGKEIANRRTQVRNAHARVVEGDEEKMAVAERG